ncbi:hypothetical protein PF004_g2968 [Phytophthora fragariae]|uniref:Uncharacterized protein n=2 Tax=Phytophthora fragariae TaxID=53985 RepID=A0A6G0PMY9_9STRA|nr:hypothetical protein PF004_g2968 [Phytophthora fragariae]
MSLPIRVKRRPLLCFGTAVGDLDDMMFGVVNPMLEVMRSKASYVDDISGARNDVGEENKAEKCAVLGTSVASGQAAEYLGWGENARRGVCEPFLTESEERDMDDGGRRRFEDGIGGDCLVEYGDYKDNMMKAEYNMRELIPYFDLDNASVESAEDFWWGFEMATEWFDDATRLRMFAARIRGTVGERWRLNSRLTDFETLKRRF